MQIFDCTNVQGRRNTDYRIPVEDYDGIDNVRDLIARMKFNGEDKAGNLEHIYTGEKVF